jgi:ATP-dependent 26S proteasome regulatory subunit
MCVRCVWCWGWWCAVIVKASSGPRYVVGCRAKVNKAALSAGVRVALDMTTLTIMRHLPREVDPMVFHMLNQDPGKLTYNDIGGLNDQIREMREVIELPLTNVCHALHASPLTAHRICHQPLTLTFAPFG